MNLFDTKIKDTYIYALNQSGANPITLGNNGAVDWNAGGVVTLTGNQTISGIKTFGTNNSIVDSTFSHILGGSDNEISNSSFSTVAGGSNNTAQGDYSNIAGGQLNETTNIFATIAGGQANTANGFACNIAGGIEHLVDGEYSSVAGGRRAIITDAHSGAAVWADGQNRDHDSRGAHTCSLDFANGVYLRLPTFAGSSSQAGNLGELKISGQFLYIATGTDSWGRTEISTFP